ncbi:MAG: phosphate signaling complex protein PhoU [Acidobacteria bacterium]|nr:phosphate signaling complex protein PhoU [Acidobacteriota bacterium]
MSRYEERLQGDLDRVRARVVDTMRYAHTAVDNAVNSLLQDDHQLAHDTVLGDLALNREIRALDRMCHAFIARHLPSAGHLRTVSAILQINIAVERIGDYAVTIAREVTQLSAPPSEEIRRDARALAQQALQMLAQATQAFEEANSELARGTIGMAHQIDSTWDTAFHDLLDAGEENQQPLRDLFALFAVFNRIERISDQAKNICEDTVFAATGQTKDPKVYRVLFLDEGNNTLSLMAEAIAAKAYPQSGTFASAGWNPGASVDAGFEAFMNGRGLSIDNAEPASLRDRSSFLADAHVLVSLAGDPRTHLDEIPYHTAVQIWDVESVPEGLDRDREDAVLDQRARDLAARIEDLMTVLHGDEAE